MQKQPSFSEFASLRFSAGGHAITRLVSQRIGAVLAWLGCRLGLSPNAITLLGALVFLLAACLYAALPAGWPSALACLLLFQLGYGIDCADGQLARATARTSPLGAWLDIACDYFRTIALGAGMAAWIVRSGLSPWAALTAAVLFSSGAAIQLHTVTVLRQVSRDTRLQTRGLAQRAREFITGFLDTATVLLVIALLRELAPLLSLYAAGVGLMYMAMATFQALNRLRKPAPDQPAETAPR